MRIKRFTLLLMTQRLLYSFVICTGIDRTITEVLQWKGMTSVSQV
jgi:predicted Fe-S protein YdhL (DUF1289 family)